MKRRQFLASPLLIIGATAHAVEYPPVVSGKALSFPRDHGSHPEFRTEWWYLTGSVRDDSGAEYGIQITFFRSRPGVAETNESAFAPRQLLFAHAAIADPRYGRLRHEQKAARSGFGLAEASTDTTRVVIDDWSLQLVQDVYAVRVAARDFTFDLHFAPTQSVLLQGDAGFSRKGPGSLQASYYYSRPQLSASGSITIEGKARSIAGRMWLDHEWSSEILASNAVGWDWTGIHFADGGALMAFRIRLRDGGTLWSGGTFRAADGRMQTLAPEDIRFMPVRQWRSPRTQLEFPVAMKLLAGGDELALEPVMDDQELDSRATTGTVYWEGLVRVMRAGIDVGRGYLELTGYGQPLRF